jgi:hypothetical protein
MHDPQDLAPEDYPLEDAGEFVLIPEPAHLSNSEVCGGNTLAAERS